MTDRASLIARILMHIPEKFKKPESAAMVDKSVNHMLLRKLEMDRGNERLGASHSMIGSAQKSAARARGLWDEDLRYLEIPNEQDPAALSDAAVSLYVPGYWRGEPIEDAVYIPNLGSLVSGGGSSLLQRIGEMYPGNPVVLESLDFPETKEFYTRKGFIPQGDNQLVPGSAHENFYLPEGRRLIRKAGGGVIRGALSKLQRMSRPAVEEGAESVAAPRGALSVVKEKGGNWLSGSVEDALRPLVRSTFRQYDQDEALRDLTPEESSRQQAINDWIQGPLTKYVKTRMATPEDEVRRLAEQGVLHFEPRGIRDVSPIMNEIYGRRITAGFPGEETAKTPLGQQWERYADAGIKNLEARDLSSAERAASFGGKSDIPPATTVHDINAHWLGGPMAQENLGFPHLIDELRGALSPESGLPRHLQLSPEAMRQMSMEKAVRRVADINAWRAARQAEASAKMSEGLPVLREYAENNPKGLRWVEFKAPENLTPEQQTYYDKLISVQTDPQVAMWAARKYGTNPLADQLKYEGDTMGHCVGGYCDEVLSGRSRIFSLRDAKGEPHVTIEVKPADPFSYHNLPADIRTASNKSNISSLEQFVKEAFPDRYDALVASAKPSIVQIKGKQNRAPNAEYLPFVQDLVRRPPEGIAAWGDVGDLGNTGLKRLSDFGDEPLLQQARRQYGDYVTQEEWDALMSGRDPVKKARGGRVQTTADL